MLAIGKRIFLFLLVNFLVITTFTIVAQIFGIGPYLRENGLDYGSLAAFCLIYGFSGSIISLMMSRAIAKWTYGVQLIEPNNTNPTLRDLRDMVARLARDAGLPQTPEVGIYSAQDINAFATGPSKSRALVAVSSGLLNSMNRDEIEGVLGHEISHIANGDMVTMTLLQGIVNAFVMFLARVIAMVVTRSDDNRNSGGFMYFIVVMVLQTAFMFLGMIVINWFSRYREFRADEGGAKLAGKNSMIHALERLQANFEAVPARQSAMQTLQISSRPSGLAALFASHPPLEARIENLRKKAG